MKLVSSTMKSLLLSLMAFLLLALPALADGGTLRTKRPAIGTPYPAEPEGYNWTGIYGGVGVGVFAGMSGLDGEVDDPRTNDDGKMLPLFNLDKVSSWGYLGDVRLGYDYHFQGSPFVVGVFGGYTWGSAEADLKTETFQGSARLDPTWNLGGRLGLGISRTLIYGGYKYSQADLKVSSGSDSKRMDLAGHSILGGMEFAVTKGFTVGLEYAYVRYEDVDMKLQGVALHAEPEAHVVMLRGNVRLGNAFGN